MSSALVMQNVIVFGLLGVGAVGLVMTVVMLVKARQNLAGDDFVIVGEQEAEQALPAGLPHEPTDMWKFVPKATNPEPALTSEGNLLQFAEEVLNLKLTPNQAAEFLGITKEALDTLMRAGELNHVKGRGGKVIDLAQLLEFKRSSGVGNND